MTRERKRARERDDQRGTSSPQARTTARSPNCSVFQDYSNLPLSWEMESTSMACRMAKGDMIKLASKVTSKSFKMKPFEKDLIEKEQNGILEM